MATELKVRYQSCDGYRVTKKFKTHAGAKAFAVKMIGRTPEMGRAYAVSDDGIGKIMVEGCTVAELFGDGPAAPTPVAPVALVEAKPAGPVEGSTGWRNMKILRNWNTDAVVGYEQIGEVHLTETIGEASAAVFMRTNEIYEEGDDEHLSAELVVFRGGYWSKYRAPVRTDATEDMPF